MYYRLKNALLRYLDENPSLARVVSERNIPLEQISVANLPRNFKFEGDRYINGKVCKTAGEYKDACDKLYGNN